MVLLLSQYQELLSICQRNGETGKLWTRGTHIDFQAIRRCEQKAILRFYGDKIRERNGETGRLDSRRFTRITRRSEQKAIDIKATKGTGFAQLSSEQVGDNVVKSVTKSFFRYVNEI